MRIEAEKRIDELASKLSDAEKQVKQSQNELVSRYFRNSIN